MTYICFSLCNFFATVRAQRACSLSTAAKNPVNSIYVVPLLVHCFPCPIVKPLKALRFHQEPAISHSGVSYKAVKSPEAKIPPESNNQPRHHLSRISIQASLAAKMTSKIQETLPIDTTIRRRDPGRQAQGTRSTSMDNRRHGNAAAVYPRPTPPLLTAFLIVFAVHCTVTLLFIRSSFFPHECARSAPQ
jgi:hypothetical protein